MSSRPLGDRAPLTAGALAGAAAYLVGYVLTYALYSDTVRESVLARVAALFGADVTVEMVGWLFYNAHFVPTVVDVDAPIFGGTDAVNFLARGDAFSPLLYLVPVLLLVGAGLAVARRHPTPSATDAAVAGGTVVVGYLPLAILGQVRFGVATEAARVAPDLVLAVALAGVGYPVVLGALGAVVAHRTA
ncbi:MAG: hypothetical protein ABEJ30_05060 [Halorientalis sp.]